MSRARARARCVSDAPDDVNHPRSRRGVPRGLNRDAMSPIGDGRRTGDLNRSRSLGRPRRRSRARAILLHAPIARSTGDATIRSKREKRAYLPPGGRSEMDRFQVAGLRKLTPASREETPFLPSLEIARFTSRKRPDFAGLSASLGRKRKKEKRRSERPTVARRE